MIEDDYKRSLALSLVINQLSESPNYLAIINAIDCNMSPSFIEL